MGELAKQFRGKKQTTGSENGVGKGWIKQELAGSKLRDARLDKRLERVMEQMAEGVGESIPWACQDWANTKAAYRFFSNDGVDEQQILAGHFQSTRERLPRGKDPILVVHDTTEFSYQREDVAAIGLVSRGSAGKDHQGRRQYFTVCGICMHSSLVVSVEGLPLGLAAIKFWNRKEFKGLQQRKKERRVAIEEKESIRWLENLR